MEWQKGIPRRTDTERSRVIASVLPFWGKVLYRCGEKPEHPVINGMIRTGAALLAADLQQFYALGSLRHRVVVNSVVRAETVNREPLGVYPLPLFIGRIIGADSVDVGNVAGGGRELQIIDGIQKLQLQTPRAETRFSNWNMSGSTPAERADIVMMSQMLISELQIVSRCRPPVH